MVRASWACPAEGREWTEARAHGTSGLMVGAISSNSLGYVFPCSASDPPWDFWTVCSADTMKELE